MMAGDTRDENQRDEEWKRLKKICRRLVEAVRDAAQWRSVALAITGLSSDSRAAS